MRLSDPSRVGLAVVLALALAAAAGCDEERPPSPPSDAGMRDASRMDADTSETDAGETPDAGDDDASLDASRDDGSTPPDAPMDPDGGEPDDAEIFGDDAGPCFLDGGAYDYCACDAPAGADCSTTPCAGGLACTTDGCGMHCTAPGRGCTSATDCAAGSTCTEVGGAMVCVRPTGCADSRDCPSGHACEAGACRDRRIRCDVDVPCPFGFVCDQVGVGTPYCIRGTTRCASDGACVLGMTCHDVDGDGERECNASSATCTVNADCPAGLTCETRPTELFAVCGNHGVCRTAADCPAGSVCADLWGDGIRECAASGGSCTSTASCTGTQVCASPSEGGAPRCMGSSL